MIPECYLGYVITIEKDDLKIQVFPNLFKALLIQKDCFLDINSNQVKI